MKDFKKIVMPGSLPHGKDGAMVPAHFCVVYKDGGLSISGVVGARKNGDAWGSCGQCADSLNDSGLELAEGWTKEQVKQFGDIWERWHLNKMRPECEHQRAAGWGEKAKEEVTLYNWTLTMEAYKQKRSSENAAVEAWKAGKRLTPTSQQVFFSGLKYRITTHTSTAPEELAAYYEPRKTLRCEAGGHIKTIKLGWVKPEEHPEGILCRPCPVCGYEYGSKWLCEKVPEAVLQWLCALPKATTPCAWKSL